MLRSGLFEDAFAVGQSVLMVRTTSGGDSGYRRDFPGGDDLAGRAASPRALRRMFRPRAEMALTARHACRKVVRSRRRRKTEVMGFRLVVNYTPRGDQAAAISSPKPTFPRATCTSRRKPRSMTNSTNCACRPHAPYSRGAIASIVASVSCIYGLGSPEAYYGMLFMLEKGQKISRNDIVSRLVDILYDRNDHGFQGTFQSSRGRDQVFPTYDDFAYRTELWGDEGEPVPDRSAAGPGETDLTCGLPIYPKTHYVMTPEMRERAMASIRPSSKWWRPQPGERGQACGGAAALPTNHVRSGNDEGDRLLPRDRELFAALFEGFGRAPRLPCLITCPPTRSCCSMRATRPFRSFGACTMATGRARRCW